MKEVIYLPEYSQVQTYIEYNENNFRDVINRFSQILAELDLNNECYKCDRIWDESDNGFMYIDGGGDDDQEIIVNGRSLHIRPFVIIYTPEEIMNLGSSWLQLSLLFWTAEIEEESQTERLNDEFKLFIWNVIEKFSKEFNQTGTFFTNEATDAKPWEAMVENKSEWLWSFDAAILPKSLFNVYTEHNKDVFFFKQLEERLFVARKLAWSVEPWR